MIEDLKRLSATCKLLYRLFPSYMIEERVIYGPDIHEAGPSSDESWQPSNYFDTPPFTDSIFMANVSAYWNDQGWGYRKGSIYVQLIRQKPNSEEKKALNALIISLEKFTDEMQPEEMQTQIYTVGKENGYKENLRDWFKLIYEVVFGDENGPRMGFFISFFGVKETQKLIKDRIK